MQTLTKQEFLSLIEGMTTDEIIDMFPRKIGKYSFEMSGMIAVDSYSRSDKEEPHQMRYGYIDYETKKRSKFNQIIRQSNIKGNSKRDAAIQMAHWLFNNKHLSEYKLKE